MLEPYQLFLNCYRAGKESIVEFTSEELLSCLYHNISDYVADLRDMANPWSVQKIKKEAKLFRSYIKGELFRRLEK